MIAEMTDAKAGPAINIDYIKKFIAHISTLLERVRLHKQKYTTPSKYQNDGNSIASNVE